MLDGLLDEIMQLAREDWNSQCAAIRAEDACLPGQRFNSPMNAIVEWSMTVGKEPGVPQESITLLTMTPFLRFRRLWKGCCLRVTGRMGISKVFGKHVQR